MIIKRYIFSPSFAANCGVIVAKLLCTEVAKTQIRSRMNINKNASSVPETMPRGPFISTGRFHMVALNFFALQLKIHGISQLLELEFFSEEFK